MLLTCPYIYEPCQIAPNLSVYVRSSPEVPLCAGSTELGVFGPMTFAVLFDFHVSLAKDFLVNVWKPHL